MENSRSVSRDEPHAIAFLCIANGLHYVVNVLDVQEDVPFSFLEEFIVIACESPYG